MRIRYLSVLAVLFNLFFLSDSNGQEIYGIVMDGEINEPLGFVNVAILNTPLGTSSDIDGNYVLTNVPAGEHVIAFSYLGFDQEERTITLREGEDLELNVTLNASGVQLDEIVVKGQAVGQRAAINQQVNSNTIVNVVSKERLRELPDQNAAEAVGRLSGVSVYRDAGEGQRISVRGISPRFNNITINGQRLPSTQEEDRSVDLSMISPEMLGGIELFKALRPDMDGDAIGGSVNFAVKTARAGRDLGINLLSNYNNLKGNFGIRSSVNYNNRFADNKLGIIVSGNFQRVDRSRESLGGSYEFLGFDANTGEPNIIPSELRLVDTEESRYRYGGALVLDYVFNPNHKLIFSSNYGRTERDEIRTRRRFKLGNNEQEYDKRQREIGVTLMSNTLNGEHRFGSLLVEWMGSYSFSAQEETAFNGRFRELSAISGAVGTNPDLEDIPGFFGNDLEATFLRDVSRTPATVDENHTTFKIDLTKDFTVGENINAYVKFGGKYNNIDRSRDRTQFWGLPYLNGENPAGSEPGLFITNPNSGRIIMANFLQDQNIDQFLDGWDINIADPELRESFFTSLAEVDLNAFNELFGTNYQPGDEINYQGHIDLDKLRAYYDRYDGTEFIELNPNIDLEDYDGNEQITAAYVMTEWNIGKRLMLMGGLRFEDTRQEYTSRTGTPRDPDDGGSGIFIDTSAAQGYNDFLPMFHVRYKLTDWMDLRGAVTKSLARPNFFNLVPWERINTLDQVIERGKPDIDRTRAWNYDLFASFYNQHGLLTIGGFYKELQGIDYVKNSTIIDQESQYNGFNLTEPANVIGTTTVVGVEVDIQGNLRNLVEGVLGGIVFGANVTYANSETFYPLFSVTTVPNPNPPPFFTQVVTDTVRSGSLVGQADWIANVVLGYETGGFSSRLSLNYQGIALSPGGGGNAGVGRIEEEDFYDDEALRLDLAVTQKLGQNNNYMIIFNVNNILNTPERAVLGVAERLVSEEFYGVNFELGLRYRIR